MQINDSLEKTLIPWKIEARRGRGQQGMRWLDGITIIHHRWTWVWVSFGVSDGQRGLVCCSPWGRKEMDMTERLTWTAWKWENLKSDKRKTIYNVNNINHWFPIKNCRNQKAISSVQFSSVAQSCPTLCDPMNCSTPGLPVHHQFPEFTQTHVHWVCDAI